MSVTIEAATLARAMKLAAAVVEGRNTIPILSNVRLKADGDTLEIVTSNIDIEFRQQLALADGDKLATTVDAKRLASLVGAVPKGSQMKLAMDGAQLAVTAGRSQWKLPVLPVDDFPTLPFDADPAMSIDAKVLEHALDRVVWSRSHEESRYYINGPLWHGDEGKLKLAATNGHSLACQKTEAVFPEGAPEVILAPKFCEILQKLCGDIAGPVSLTWDDRKFRAKWGEITITAKVIDGTFPDYRRVIPAESDTCTLDPQSLREAIRRVRVLGTDRTNCIVIDRSEGKWRLSQADPENGSAAEDLPADTGSDVRTGFNGEYLDRMCAAVGGETMLVDQYDAATMGLFRRAVPDGFVGVIMPIRV